MRLTVGIGKLPQNPTTAFRAEPARFCTNATMLVVIRMFVTFCPAGRARSGACFHEPAKQLRVIDSARKDPRRRGANIRARKVQANTALEREDIGLLETSVGAGETGELASHARFRAIGERTRVHGGVFGGAERGIESLHGVGSFSAVPCSKGHAGSRLFDLGALDDRLQRIVLPPSSPSP